MRSTRDSQEVDIEGSSFSDLNQDPDPRAIFQAVEPPRGAAAYAPPARIETGERSYDHALDALERELRPAPSLTTLHQLILELRYGDMNKFAASFCKALQCDGRPTVDNAAKAFYDAAVQYLEEVQR